LSPLVSKRDLFWVRVLEIDAAVDGKTSIHV
jgi:hypothetical protein